MLRGILHSVADGDPTWCLDAHMLSYCVRQLFCVLLSRLKLLVHPCCQCGILQLHILGFLQLGRQFRIRRRTCALKQQLLWYMMKIKQAILATAKPAIPARGLGHKECRMLPHISYTVVGLQDIPPVGGCCRRCWRVCRRQFHTRKRFLLVVPQLNPCMRSLCHPATSTKHCHHCHLVTELLDC